MLETALTMTDSVADPSVSESFASYHAFIRARIRALPPYRGRSLSATGERRHAWSRDRRAMLAAEFLASDEAEDLSDRGSASHCADRIIDYGCDKDFGRPLRMSPTKVETFLLSWLPRKVMLSFAEQDAMPHVLAAWVRWAGRRRGLPEAAITESLEAVFNSMGAFAQAYRDPAEFGLDYALVRRLLPDADLEALPRRAFAFPVLEGWHSGSDLSILDPADPNDRRALLAADHATPAPGGVGRHIERHLVLADRLWRGDPPELWEAAQRLLDAGQDRHLVLHALMAVLDHTSGDEAALIAVLRELEADEPYRLRGGESLARSAVSTAAGGLDDEHVAGLDRAPSRSRPSASPGRRRARSSAGPGAPGSPPARPNAGTRRWPVSVVTVIGSTKRSLRTPPWPPRQRPAPPLPGLIRYDSSSTG